MCDRRSPCMLHANKYAPMPNYDRPRWLPYWLWVRLTVAAYRRTL